MAQKILVIEDEKNISDLLQLYLEKEGYETQTAGDVIIFRKNEVK